jgi:hypothetical protein
MEFKVTAEEALVWRGNYIGVSRQLQRPAYHHT